MSVALKNCKVATSPGSGASTCSPELADGATPSNLPAGHIPGLFGPVAARVNRSAQRARKKASKTAGISGRICFASSASVALQRSLASRLAETMDTDGSPEFSMTWKRRATLAGLRICRLAASERHTSDTGYFGWPTPDANRRGDTQNPAAVQERLRKSKLSGADKKTLTIQDAAQLVKFLPHPTPMAGTAATEAYHEAGNTDSSRKTVALFKAWKTPLSNHANGTPERFLERKQESIDRTGTSMGIVLSDLNMQAQSVLKSWATPRTRDHKNNGVSIARAAKGVADSLDLQCKLVCLNGTEGPSPLTARMDRGGYRLNPAHSRWLQGYPVAWCACAATAIQSCRMSRRRSSARSSKAK